MPTPAPRFRIGDGTSHEHVRFVRELLSEAGWRETGTADFDLLWSDATLLGRELRQHGAGRAYNHFPGLESITRKDSLAWTLALQRLENPRLAPRRSFHPETFVMPDDREELLAAARRNPRAIWIYKPAADSNGRGIRLLPDAASAPRRPGRIVQRYLDAPHLLDGFKYTLRCYVAVASFEPMRAWLFDDGFTKLTSRPFTTSREQLQDRCVHLTNPEVQRENLEVATSSRNLTHQQYRARLRREGIDDDALFAQIRQIAASTLLAARPFVLDRSARFLPRGARAAVELLGLDLLVDRTLRPWLIECNAGPSLAVEASPTTPSARAEYQLKRRVVRDLLRRAALLPEKRGEPNGFEPLFDD
jgi:tubulin polyglutamylase TTLL5